MDEDRSPLTKIRDAVPAIVILLPTASYLMTLTAYYSWWVVLLVSPLVVVGAAFAMGLLWLSSDILVFRVIWFVFGTGLAWLGLTETHRLGSFLVGIAFILIGLFPSQSVGRRPDASTEHT